MLKWLPLGISLLAVAFVLYKAFWKPPEPDPDKKHDSTINNPGVFGGE